MTTMTNTETFLPPIENPPGLMMKLMYWFVRRQFGKVFTPMKVIAARMPMAFGQFSYNISKLDKKLQLPEELIMLIRQRVAQINVCTFCVDISRAYTIMTSMKQEKFDALDEYATSPLFTEAERAALDYATELTQNKKVARSTFDRLAKHYSERAICEIVWLVASEHYYNISNHGLNIHSDMLCDIAKKRKNENVRFGHVQSS